jgi:hypothetical protein
MHRELANGRIVILENYLAPCDFVAENGEPVKEGTWLQGRGYRVMRSGKRSRMEN